MKIGDKSKSVVFIILFSVFKKTMLFMYNIKYKNINHRPERL